MLLESPKIEDFGLSNSIMESYQLLEKREKKFARKTDFSISLILMITTAIILYYKDFSFWGILIISILVGEVIGTFFNNLFFYRLVDGIRKSINPKFKDDTAFIALTKNKYDKFLQEKEKYDVYLVNEEKRIREERSKKAIERKRIEKQIKIEQYKIGLDEKKHEYEEAQKRLSIERLTKEYWINLDGFAFEREMGELFKKCNFTSVVVTPSSGDFGVDIRMEKDNLKYIVQCKNWIKPSPPSDIIQLYGSLMDEKADMAIFVCTGGFSSRAIKWILDKPFELIDINKIVEMQTNAIYVPYTKNAMLETAKLIRAIQKDAYLEYKNRNKTHSRRRRW